MWPFQQLGKRTIDVWIGLFVVMFGFIDWFGYLSMFCNEFSDRRRAHLSHMTILFVMSFNRRFRKFHLESLLAANRE